MAATMSITRPTITIKESLAQSLYTCSTTPTGNNNTDTSLMYPYSYEDEKMVPKGLDALECYGVIESGAQPINLPPGYISISSFSRSRTSSTESDEVLHSSKYETDFLSSPFKGFTKRRRKVSFAEEALPPEDYAETSKEDSSSSKIAELIPSLSSLSLPKLPERSWFCNSCRKPKDECNCLCVIS